MEKEVAVAAAHLRAVLAAGKRGTCSPELSQKNNIVKAALDLDGLTPG